MLPPASYMERAIPARFMKHSLRGAWHFLFHRYGGGHPSLPPRPPWQPFSPQHQPAKLVSSESREERFRDVLTVSLRASQPRQAFNVSAAHVACLSHRPLLLPPCLLRPFPGPRVLCLSPYVRGVLTEHLVFCDNKERQRRTCLDSDRMRGEMSFPRVRWCLFDRVVLLGEAWRSSRIGRRRCVSVVLSIYVFSWTDQFYSSLFGPLFRLS